MIHITSSLPHTINPFLSMPLTLLGIRETLLPHLRLNLLGASGLFLSPNDTKMIRHHTTGDIAPCNAV